jgi:FAD:protein FMN transferase
MTAADTTFRALGTDVRLVVVDDDADALVDRATEEIADYDARLTRFRPDSELCALNADEREEVPASPPLREAVSAALWAAERSGGLVDPCLLDALEAAGYAGDFRSDGILAAPAGAPRPVNPDPAERWRSIRVTGTAVVRPAGLRLDLGGTGKGHVADRVAKLLDGARRWAVDCGGDVRVGGGEQEVLVAHPLRDEIVTSLRLSDHAVATSSTVARSWATRDGGRAHHLLDPATGRPAWTGLLAVTAVAATTLEAETLAKTVLLRGPDAGRAALGPHGGILFHADGSAEHLHAAVNA